VRRAVLTIGGLAVGLGLGAVTADASVSADALVRRAVVSTLRASSFTAVTRVSGATGADRVVLTGIYEGPTRGEIARPDADGVAIEFSAGRSLYAFTSRSQGIQREPGNGAAIVASVRAMVSGPNRVSGFVQHGDVFLATQRVRSGGVNDKRLWRVVIQHSRLTSVQVETLGGSTSTVTTQILGVDHSVVLRPDQPVADNADGEIAGA
jgi:hypothetical protein